MRMLNNQKGFGLVECILSIFIISIAFVAMVDMFNVAASFNKRAKSWAIAQSLLQEGMEGVKNRGYGWLTEDWSDTDLTLTVPDGFPLKESKVHWNWVSDGGNPQAYKEVEVSIKWYGENVTRELKAVTYLSEHE